MWNNPASLDVSQASLNILEKLDLFWWTQLGEKP